MHELGLCEAVVSAVERRAAGRVVTGIRLRAGVLHRLDRPAFDQAFSLAATGTVAENATVDLVLVPLLIRCRTCGDVAECDDVLPRCGACGSFDLHTEGGDELTLVALELAGPGTEGAGESDPPCA